jgi:hypothetical protein
LRKTIFGVKSKKRRLAGGDTGWILPSSIIYDADQPGSPEAAPASHPV